MSEEEVNKGGRPLKFGTVEELQEAIDNYFEKCDVGVLTEVYDRKNQEFRSYLQKTPYSITGLALALHTSRRVLCEYGLKDEYSNAIMRAKLFCENWVEIQALRGNLPSGIVCFMLKNYEWKDKCEIVSAITERRLIINRWKEEVKHE